MDENLGSNDPYRGMDSGEEGIRPDFLRNKGEAGKGALAAAENVASMAIAAKTGKAPSGAAGGVAGESAGGIKSAKNGAKEGFKSSVGKTSEGEEKSGSLYKGNRSEKTKEDGEVKLDVPKGLKAAAPFLILFIALGGILFLLIGLPVLMIGAIDYNLQKVLGFTETVGILEKQGEHVTEEMMASGKMPTKYSSDLAANGMEIGQVLANGDFVRTDVYIADIENRNDLVASASGFNYISDDEGQLAMLYNGKIIAADDFVAAVESDPKLYAAYANAANISTKYYYGDDVEKVYQDMGISRGNFNDWETTGNYEEDEKNYREILTRVLDKKASLVVGGKNHDTIAPQATADVEPSTIALDNSGTWQEPMTDGDAAEKDKIAANKTKEYITGWHVEEYNPTDTSGNPMKNPDGSLVIKKRWAPDYSTNATARASELLNTAVSSGEPYLASSAFVAVEESIQRARVDGDGPVNHVMNSLTESTEVEYQDVATAEMKKSTLSILETDNFRAVVSDAPYSLDEAENFGRDRVLKTTGQGGNPDVIKMTTVGVGDNKSASSVSRNGLLGPAADEATVAKANENVAMMMSKSNSEMFQSVVGGNRIIEGGSFLSNTINSKVIGAVPSNEEAVAKYYRTVKETLDRKDEAERATLSPFDISSPNTFLGSIVHNFAKATIRNYNSGGLNSLAAAIDTTGTAVASLTGSASAEGIGQTYTTLSGNGCETVGAVGVTGDIYCTSHNTVEADYTHLTRDEWKGVVLYTKDDGTVVTLGDSLDEENKIKDKSELADFVAVGMDRYATVGVRSANACEAYRNSHDKFWEKLKGKLLDMAGLYDSCEGVEEKYSTGAYYTFGGTGAAEYTKYLSGYMLYDEVYSLLSDQESTVAEYRDRYYTAHPQNRSEAGIIAMRSGMSVDEAEMALAYADYLNMIANYDASDRFAFGRPLFEFDTPMLIDYSDTLALNLYAWHLKETEYDDLRTRNFVV